MVTGFSVLGGLSQHTLQHQLHINIRNKTKMYLLKLVRPTVNRINISSAFELWRDLRYFYCDKLLVFRYAEIMVNCNEIAR